VERFSLSERRTVDVLTFGWKAPFESLNGETCLIVASSMQEHLYHPKPCRNDKRQMPHLFRSLNDISKSFERRRLIGFSKTPSFKHMHADAVCIGADAFAPSPFDQGADLFARELQEMLFRSLLEAAHNLSGFRPSAVQSDQQAHAWNSGAARAIERGECGFPHHRRKK